MSLVAKSPDVSASISACDLYTLGFLLKIPFLATKNFLSVGSMPAKTAGAPSHLTVTSVVFFELPANISRIALNASMASRAPLTPP